MKNLKFLIFILLCNCYYNQIYVPQKTIKKLTDLKTEFFFGLDNNDLKTSNKINFDIDFHYYAIIVHEQTLCQNQNNCRFIESKNKDTGNYKDQIYSYGKIKTFLGLRHQITTTIKQEQLTNFVNLPIRKLNEQHDQFSNVLGLSISSPIWQHWIDLYNFKSDIIHIDIILEKDNEQIVFWNLYWPLKNTWLPVSKKNQRYIWNMVVRLNFNISQSREFITVFSFDNNKDLLFEVKKETYDILMQEICIDSSNCTQQQHLNPNIDLQQIRFQSSQDTEQIINIQDLYQIQKNGQIKFYFKMFRDWTLQVDIILQQRFFQQYYLSIQNNLQNQKYYFLKISHLDTLKKQFENEYIKFVLLFLSISLLITFSYAIYSKLFVRRKILKKLDRDNYQKIN